MMAPLKARIEEAVAFLRTRTSMSPGVGIILGTGLGGLAKEITASSTVDYSEIPHFPVSTVESHHGRLVFGILSGKEVVAMQGRFHFYEGYTMEQVVFPVRVLKFLGVETLLMSNAAGGMNPNFSRGSLMMISDHINLTGENPLVGINDESLGPRFPDMSEPYSRELIERAEEVARKLGIRTERGVFVAVTGPNLETRAEYRFLRHIGADAVGMSTVPENIAANHLGLKVFGMSIITDECFPDALKPAKVSEIIAVAMEAEPRLTAVMKGLVATL
jgi:purine-nucleoside phosphorylase